MSQTAVRRSRAWTAFLIVLGLIAAGRPAVAADAVTVDRGYLDMNLLNGPLVLGGTGGFTFQGLVSVSSGVFNPWQDCNGDPLHCLPGTTLDLRAGWSGLDLAGRATYQGVVYRVGGDLADMTAEFTGTATLPPLADSAAVTAPFTFVGAFRGQTVMGGPQVSATLSGVGVATLYLIPDENYVGSWHIERVVYEFGPIVPTPWQSKDIGDSHGGRAIYADGTFVVTGDGADIYWGVDAFQFTYRPLEGDGDIVARVVTQTATYPWAATHPWAKGGVMLRESTNASSAHVILDVRPDGAIEFMTRLANGAQTTWISGAVAPGPPTWLKLSRTGSTITGFISADGAAWTEVGTTMTTLPGGVLAGLAVTSHDVNVLNLAIFDHVAVNTSQPQPTDLIIDGGFEQQVPPALGPGWVSDYPFRQVPGKSETHQPRTGQQNGACWTPDAGDCGIYQELLAPVTGTYTLTMPASADRPGGLVGANVNGGPAAMANVDVRDFGVYESYTMTFTANAGDTIRVWMYSPWTRGYVVIDDVTLTVAP